MAGLASAVPCAAIVSRLVWPVTIQEPLLQILLCTATTSTMPWPGWLCSLAASLILLSLILSSPCLHGLPVSSCPGQHACCLWGRPASAQTQGVGSGSELNSNRRPSFTLVLVVLITRTFQRLQPRECFEVSIRCRLEAQAGCNGSLKGNNMLDLLDVELCLVAASTKPNVGPHALPGSQAAV